MTGAYLLRGRQAWIEARRRRRPEAIRLMRTVLEENQSYSWGWHRLTGWLLEEEETDQAATALEHLRRLRPHDAGIHRQLAFLRRKQDDRTGACEAFAAALALEPSDDVPVAPIFRHVTGHLACLRVAAQVAKGQAEIEKHPWLDMVALMPGAADMHLFLAVEKVLAGDVAAARDHLERTAVRDDVSYDLQLLTLARAITDFLQEPRGERRGRFPALREALGAHFERRRLSKSLRDVRRTFRRTGRLLVREGAGIKAWWWFAWRLNWRWSLGPLGIAALGVIVMLPPPAKGLVWGVVVSAMLWRRLR